MAKALEVLRHVSDFVEHRESLDILEDWSASYLHDVYLHGDEEDQNAIQVVRSVLNAFENDGELVLRKEMQAAMRPFEESGKIQPRQANVGSNDSGGGLSSGFPISGNNHGSNSVTTFAA